MPKMTKAQARKRLEEAADKVAKVWGAGTQFRGGLTITKRDSNDLIKIFDELNRLVHKMK